MIQKSEYDIEWFINTVLLGDIKTMICDHSLHYLGFGTVASAIEFLGACTDDKPFNQQGLSRKRFEAAITLLFDCAYHQYASVNSQYDLFKHLRCGMAHIMRPLGKVAFTTHAESIQDNTQHLQVHPDINQLILISETLYNDFAEACRKLKSNLRAGMYHKHLSDKYMTISDIEP